MNFLGIDPGKTGALVLLDENGKIQFQAIIPLIAGKEIDKPRLAEYFKTLKENYYNEIHVILEDVHSIFGAGAKSNFSFGFVNGLLEGFIVSNGMKYTKCSPTVWQKIVWEGVRPITFKDKTKILKSGVVKEKIDTKSTTLLAIKRLFPNDEFVKSAKSKKDDSGLVDAAALAYYGFQKFNKK